MTALKQDAYQNALALFKRPDSTCMACPSLSLLDGNRHLPLFRNHGLAVVEAMRSSSVEHLPWWGSGWSTDNMPTSSFEPHDLVDTLL